MRGSKYMEIYPFGSVLRIQREQSWEDIFRLMKSMKDKGMNMVYIWPAVYWWEDKNLPDYPYQTGHEILKYAEKIDIKVVMELAGQITSLEYAPDFLMKDEYYAVTRDGNKDLGGMFYGYINFNHPEVKRLIEKQYTEEVENYKQYASLYGYDIWNETMFTSFDIHTLKLFRDWLKNKYDNIKSLNISWDRVYEDWSQVDFTPWLWASVMPKVDYEQFHKDNIVIILDHMKAIIKAKDDIHPVIADNIFSTLTLDEFYDRPQDDWGVAKSVDIFGIDIYPKFTATEIPSFVRWQTLECAHSASKPGKFWISELQTHHTTMFSPQSYVYPHEMRMWTWEAISHGAKGITYWKWDPFNRGVQTFGRGLVTSKGEYTPRADEAESIAKVISENQRQFVGYNPQQANVAILFDRLDQDFIKALTLPFDAVSSLGANGKSGNKVSKLYIESLRGMYKALYEQNISAEYVSPEDIINKSIDTYKVLFVSNQVNICGELAEGLRHYVEQGGVVVSDGKFGEIDNIGYTHSQIPGSGLSDMAGFELLDMQPDHLEMTADFKDGCGPLSLEGCHERRQIKILDHRVEVVAQYQDGSPAIVRSKYGKGEFIYISTFLWYGYLKNEQLTVKKFIANLNKEHNLSLFESGDNLLKICTLKGEDGYLLFAFNYNKSETTAEIKLFGDFKSEFQVVDILTKSVISAETSDGGIKFVSIVEGSNTAIFKICRPDSSIKA
jgi:beta-galactosidase